MSYRSSLEARLADLSLQRQRVKRLLMDVEGEHPGVKAVGPLLQIVTGKTGGDGPISS